MIENRKKTVMQYKVANLFLKKGGRGTLEMATGTSKTRVALIVAKHLIDNNRIDSVLIVVPSESIRDDTWPKEIEKWIGSEYRSFFQIDCIQTVYKETEQRQFIICDEIHNMVNRWEDYSIGIGEYVKFFKNNPCKYLMGLSALIPANKRRTLSAICPIIFTLPIDKAVKEGYVSNFLIVNYGIHLDEINQQEYDKIQERVIDLEEELGGSDVAYTNSNTYINAFSDIKYSISKEERKKLRLALDYKRAINDRKIFLSTRKQKLSLCTELSELYGKKHIIFSSSKEASNLLEKLIPNSVKVHSGVSRGKRRKALEAFQEEEELKTLLAVNAINEGVNTPAVKLSILESGNSTPKDLVQRLGRNLRIIDGEKIAIFIQLYFKNTQDAVWTRNRTYPIPKNKVKEINNLQNLMQLIK